MVKKKSNEKPNTNRWHNEKNLEKWFSRLTPEQRLDIALQIERFRREARFVEDRKAVRISK